MIINVSYDLIAPTAFKAIINDVVDYFENLFVNPITININVGWGEVNGESLVSGALGESMSTLAPVTYTQIRNALVGNSEKSLTDVTALANLPSSDPIAGGT